jgi:HEAT repeat protein
VAAVWKYADGSGASALAAVNAAIHLKLTDRADKLIPILQSANKALRKAAINGLKDSDMPDVNTALRKVVDEDPDAALQDLASSILANSSDPTYAAAAQYHALKSKEPTIVLAATKALGSSKLAEAGVQLVSMIGHEDYRVREAAISSLMKRGDFSSLVDQLKSTKFSKEVRAEVAKALRKANDAKAAYQAISHLAVHGTGTDAVEAAEALGNEKPNASFGTLGSALKHAEAPVRRAAAKSLAKLGKPIALSHLAAADLDDKETGQAVREAIRAVYAQQSLDFVMKGTKDTNVMLKRSAVATLGDMVKTASGKRARKKILNALRPLSKASDATIRAAAIRSFEIMAGDDVRADVMRMSEDEAVEVQRAVAHALRAFASPKSTTLLLKYIQSADATVVANAASSIGRLKIKEALNPIIKILGHQSVDVRRAATQALVLLGTTLTERKPLLSFFSERLFDADGKVRLMAIEGLKLVKDARSVTAMGALLQDPLLQVRIATLDAMADTGHKSAVEPIASALEDENKDIRHAALKALVKLKRKEAAALIKAHLLREKDTNLIEVAKKAINQLQ